MARAGAENPAGSLDELPHITSRVGYAHPFAKGAKGWATQDYASLSKGGPPATSVYFPLPGGATVFESASGKHFWHKDWLGSVRFSSSVVNRTGIYDRAFAPFGEPYNNFGTTTNYDFTGDTQDTASGTYDTPNRELNPNQGRWISPDPAGLGAVDFNNPQTLNRYSYVANYPLTVTDPTGMDFGYDTYDPGSSHAGPGSLLDAFVAAVDAVRNGTPLPSPGERFNSDDYSPFEYQSGNQTFTTWAAAAAFFQAQNEAQVPTSLHVESATDMTRSNPAMNYGIFIDVKYQVLDQNGKPIQSDKMQIMESGTFGDGTKYSGPIVSKKADENHTQSDGTFHDKPVGDTRPKPVKGSIKIQQNITIVMGDKQYKVRSQTYTVTSEGYGKGRIVNDLGDIDVTRP